MNEDISRIFGSFIVVGLMTVFGAIAASITYIRRLRDGREFRLASFILRVSMGGFVATATRRGDSAAHNIARITKTSCAAISEWPRHLIRGLNIPVNDYLAIFSSGVIGATADATWELMETKGLGILKDVLQKKKGGFRGDDTSGR